MHCCSKPAIPKTSRLGTFFFAHQRKGDCVSVPESAEHLYCKHLIAQAAMTAGWTVSTEFPGSTPAGDKWEADVYCTKGIAKIALEIQMSPQDRFETQRRQDRYEASGVRCAWFFGPKGLSGASENYFSQKTPAFVLKEIEIGQEPLVASQGAPLGEFVRALLSKRVIWHTETEAVTHLIVYVEDVCHRCKRSVKQIYEHAVEGYEDFLDRAYTPATLSTALEGIAESFSNGELLALGLNKIGRIQHIKGKPARWPYLNICRHCGAHQSNFFLSKRILEAMKAVPGQPLDPFSEPLSQGPFGVEKLPRIHKGKSYWKLLREE